MSTVPSSPFRRASAGSPHRHRRPPRPAAQPFARIVDLVHDTTDGLPGPTLVGIEYHPVDLLLATWPLDDTIDPLASLVGWVAPPTWDALGVSGPVEAWRGGRSAGPDDPGGDATRCTVLLERDAEAIMLAEMPGGGVAPTPAFADPITDVLSRALGRPTLPPDMTTAAWFEHRWIDALTTAALATPGLLTWDDAAALHPLCDGGRVAPETLALASLAAEQGISWQSLRAGTSLVVDGTHHPAGGSAVALANWFDDGSFARWIQRDLPPVAELLDAVLATVPDAVADAILAALVAS